MLFASYSPCIESRRLRRMRTRRPGINSRQHAMRVSAQRAWGTHLALRAALLVIDHTNKFQCFNHKAAFDGPPDWISHASLMLHSASFECSCWPAPLPPGGAPAPLLSLSADTRGRTCSPRGRRRHHPGVRPAKGQCRSRSVLTPLALDALGPFSPHPTAQVLRLA